jgi:cysteinyl-tRNA synthetase
MKLYNALTRNVEELTPLQENTIRIYSCGPTVYDHAHIGNLSAYIFADTLRRVVTAAGYAAKHAMNYTDVDDKTIRRSRERYPDDEPMEALHKLTGQYISVFLDDMEKIGNQVDSVQFIRATDDKTIIGMQELIARLQAKAFAYVAEDGVYFSIEAYRRSGKTYGQLLELNAGNTSEARIQNDEYDKESIHDFALWKAQKEGEPAWPFTLDGKDLTGRPGWHIECSVMSRQALGQPFDIHTGGIDLLFPHHENEIAQSTALEDDPVMARFFCYNEHILAAGKKMAKSAGNFYTLDDIIKEGYDPLAFRLLVLQAHYRSQVNFTWESLDAAQNALKNFYAWADLQFQNFTSENLRANYSNALAALEQEIFDDLKTPAALAFFNGMITRADELGPDSAAIVNASRRIDSIFGLRLSQRKDISEAQKQLIAGRQTAREAKDWAKSDELRRQLNEQGIGVRDTEYGPVWYRL